MKNFKSFMKITSKKQFLSILNTFIPFCKKELGLKDSPEIVFMDKKQSKYHNTFGFYKNKKIHINISDRHPIDILRTVAHELVHYSQHKNKKVLDGSTGSKTENEANAKAGIILRKFNTKYPELFKMKSLKENEC